VVSACERSSLIQEQTACHVVVPVQSSLNVIVLLEFYSRYDMPATLVWKQNILTLFTGKGAVRLADAVLRAVEQPVEFKFLYDVEVCF